MNSMYFHKEDVEAGLMAQLIEYLCNYSYASGPRKSALYNDIHIRPEDMGAFVVEWEQVPWSHDYGGRFEFVKEDQIICTEVALPDGTYQYVENPDEYFQEWLTDHPTWYRNQWGHWCDKEKDLQQMQFYQIDDQD